MRHSLCDVDLRCDRVIVLMLVDLNDARGRTP